jgi:hypothetical protein
VVAGVVATPTRASDTVLDTSPVVVVSVLLMAHQLQEHEPPVCDVCQERPVTISYGCVEMCAPCALDDLDRHLDELDPENHLGRDLELTADELLLEHGIAVAS